MKKYQYVIIRYIHDRITSEFVNVGIVLYNQEFKFLKTRIILKYGRISQFFNEINGRFIISLLKNFEKEITKESSSENFNYDNVLEVVNSILPLDDGSIVFSDVYEGIDIDFDLALDDLYNRIVDKYNPESDRIFTDDSYVWKNIYKQYFDKYGITNKLEKHTVQTSHDKIDFSKAWKNSVWHCYEPISFDLKHSDSIKNKVYKWSGILNELENSEQEINLNFLTRKSHIHASLEGFINDVFLNRDSDKLKISLIDENNADDFAKSVSEKIDQHNMTLNNEEIF